MVTESTPFTLEASGDLVFWRTKLVDNREPFGLQLEGAHHRRPLDLLGEVAAWRSRAGWSRCGGDTWRDRLATSNHPRGDGRMWGVCAAAVGDEDVARLVVPAMWNQGRCGEEGMPRGTKGGKKGG